MADTTSHTNVYRIEPLAGAENYAVWKIKMMDILTGLDLWDYVDGTTKMPETPTALAAWKKKDRSALSAIRLRVGDKMLVYVASAESAKDAWESLKAVLETQGALGIVLARRKLFRAECTEGTTIDDHIRTLRGYQEELHNLGQKIDGEEFSIVFLTSLLESWDNYIASIDTTALKDSAKLIARILEHDRRINLKSSEDTALVAKTGKKKRNPNIVCWNCEEKGHIGRFCKKPQKKGKGKDQKGKKADSAHATVDDDDFAFCGLTDDIAMAVTPDSWLADSACTSHMVKDRDLFTTYQPTPGHRVKGFGKAPGLGRGTVQIECTVEGKTTVTTLNDAVHVPDAPFNLISIGRAEEAGVKVLFANGKVKFRTPNGKILMEGSAGGRMFEMQVRGVPAGDQAHVAKSGRTWDEWHRILGHLNIGSVKMLKSKGMVLGMDVNEDAEVDVDAKCEACILAKQHVKLFPKQSQTEIKEIGDLTVSDVWGPARTAALGGERYFVSYTDGRARRTMIYCMKEKSKAFTKFKQYKSFIEVQTGRKLKILRIDGGGEYISKEFKKYLLDNGIQLQVTAPHSPSQNGIAERLNRTLVEHGRAMIVSHGLPNCLWREAIIYANDLKNVSPTRGIKELKTPDEVFWKKKPDISHLEEFGRDCYVLQQDRTNSKLDPKSRKFIFVGIDAGTKGYKYYKPSTRKVLMSRNVEFLDKGESKIVEEVVPPVPLEGESAGSKRVPGEQDNSTAPIEGATADKAPLPPREKSSRIRAQPLVDYLKLNNPNARGSRQSKQTEPPEEDETGCVTMDYALVGAEEDPTTVKEAKDREDWPEWRTAMDSEMLQLEKRGTFKLVELPPDRSAIASKWVYRLKKDHIGEIIKHKARVVAKGCSQIPGLDFLETFAPVMRLETFRLLIAIGTELGLVVHVVDVVGAYLNGKLEEVIFMMQPPEYDDGSGRVWQLLRPLYGLKQAGRAWNEELNATFQKLKFTRLLTDQCVYIRVTDQELSITAVHIDDITILGSDIDAVNRVKDDLRNHFTITDLGEAKQVVGLELERDHAKGTTKIFQSQYIKKILERFGMENSHPVATPMDPNIKLIKTPDDEHYDILDYRSAIGSLMYAAIGTRPDIAFAVQCLSQFLNNPGPAHWTAVKRVFRYLNGTRNLGIVYRKGGEVEPLGYTDADWGLNPNDRRSISGNVFLLALAAITWQSRKQPTIALSTLEAEYMAESLTARQVIWLRMVLAELGFRLAKPTTLMVDNQGAISYSTNPVHHARTKHIDIQHHFVREKIVSNEIEIQHCATDDNLADLLTKALPAPKHQEFVRRMGMA